MILCHQYLSRHLLMHNLVGIYDHAPIIVQTFDVTVSNYLCVKIQQCLTFVFIESALMKQSRYLFGCTAVPLVIKPC